MSARRVKTPEPPQAPSGYRATRRASKAAKQAKRADRQHRLVVAMQRANRNAKNTVIVALQGLAAVGLGIIVLLLAALLINTAVRWNAERVASLGGEQSRRELQAKENLLVIGADDDTKAIGFLALRVDAKTKQVYGIAIPEGAFIEVPGQGFARIGDAYPSGAGLTASAISNYLTVPFHSYVIVPSAVYSDAIRRQVVKGLPSASTSSNLSAEELAAVDKGINEIPGKNVALVPLPVKPIKLGDQTYFEPQRDDVADLLKSWWGVDPSAKNGVTRVVVFNGAGNPGIAGEAAQQLIRAGLRVVDTQNADSFDYATTRIIVRRGDQAQGTEVRKVLGVGTVESEPSNQNVTDVVVIIGKDYTPPKSGSKEGD